MNRPQVVALLARIKQPIEQSNAYQITLRRAGFVSNLAPNGPDVWFRDVMSHTCLEQLWRLRTGSGIAGHSGRWMLEHMPNGKPALGPFTTQKQLAAAIRLWRRWELP